MAYLRISTMLLLTAFVAGCGSKVKEPEGAAAPTLAAPKPIAAPPPAVAAAAPAPVAQAPAAVMPSSDPDAMLIVQPTRYEVVGRQAEIESGEKLIAMVPSIGADRFVIETAGVPANPAAMTTFTQRLPAGFTPMVNYGVDSSGYAKRILCERDKTEMVLVPAGVFQMGSDDGLKAAQPQHAMYVDPYYIDVNETTVALFNAFREEQKTRKQRVAEAPLNATGDPMMPALGVNFSDARAYAKAVGKDLPTESEWEKAGRGTTQGNEYPWGQGRPTWRTQKEPGSIQRIGEEPTDISVYGVKDLAGNAREWCMDLFAIDAYPKLLADAKDVPRNWAGPRNATVEFERTVKGSSPDWKLSHRAGVVMTENVPDIGFRCVLRLYQVD